MPQVVQEAICPERKRGLDDQLSAVASITEVYVSGDLQVSFGLEIHRGERLAEVGSSGQHHRGLRLWGPAGKLWVNWRGHSMGWEVDSVNISRTWQQWAAFQRSTSLGTCR
jgi:hypothetical protein